MGLEKASDKEERSDEDEGRQERDTPHRARTASDILVADLDLPHKSQEKCVPKGVSKVCPIPPSILW